MCENHVHGSFLHKKYYFSSAAFLSLGHRTHPKLVAFDETTQIRACFHKVAGIEVGLPVSFHSKLPGPCHFFSLLRTCSFLVRIWALVRFRDWVLCIEKTVRFEGMFFCTIDCEWRAYTSFKDGHDFKIVRGGRLIMLACRLAFVYDVFNIVSLCSWDPSGIKIDWNNHIMVGFHSYDAANRNMIGMKF